MNNDKQNHNDKESYSEPELIVHGDVEEITQQAGAENSDVQPGIANTAFPLRSV
jgi:hypothetical protein